MADITLCEDKKCPHKEKCQRFKSKANPYMHSYFNRSPRQGDNCNWRIPLKEEYTLLKNPE